MQKQIEFEDHGQDFLRWTIDNSGKVIDCQPFQASVWCDAQVINHIDLAVGDYVTIIRREDEEPITIKYPLASIEMRFIRLNNAES